MSKKKTTKKPPKRIGRPPKAGEKMTERIPVQVEPSRKLRYQEAAARRGMDVAAWVRLACDRLAESKE